MEPDFVDISGWQWPIDASKMASKVDTVWVRCSIRTAGGDQYWWPFQHALRDRGAKVNAYAVWDSRYSGQGHWQNLKKRLLECPVGDRHHFEIAIDVEDNVRRTSAQLDQLRILVEESSMWNGRPSWIYTSPGLWNYWANHGAVGWANNYPLWVADYEPLSVARGFPDIPSDWEDYGAWQYSADGNGRGPEFGTLYHSDSIDLNVWNISGR